MSDITKCTNEKCLLKESCKRFMCQPDSHWQSYSDFKPDVLYGKDGKQADYSCNFFLKINKKND